MSAKLAVLLLALACIAALIVWALVILERYNGMVSRLTKRYDAYLSKENEKLRRLYKLRNQEALYNAAVVNLPLVAGLVHIALGNCAVAIDAIVPSNIYGLMDAPHITVSPKDLVVYHFRWHMKRSCQLTAKDIERIFNAELRRVCNHHGCGILRARITITPDGMVIAEGVWLADFIAIQNREIEI